MVTDPLHTRFNHAKTNVRSAGIRKFYGTTPAPSYGNGLEAHGTCCVWLSTAPNLKGPFFFVVQRLCNLTSHSSCACNEMLWG